MKKRFFALVFLIFFVIASSCVLAEKQMILLAVEETSLGTRGTTANVHLKTIEGTGEIYSATFPLTEMDTQISTRLAKDIACDFAKHRCNRDFLYMIKSNSSIVGGPSGGAAITILTIAELKKENIDGKVTITGTINSGGLIGPVGGLIEKIKAASNCGLETVIIPKGTRYAKPNKEKNMTVDLVEFGKDNNVTVIEVARIDEAYAYFTGNPYEEPKVELIIDEDYKNTMNEVASFLCNYSNENKTKKANKITKEADNLIEQAQVHFDNGDHYTAASLCFGANIKYRQADYENLTYLEIKNKTENLEKRKDSFVLPKYSSINDLQTFMIVKERIFETENLLMLAKTALNMSNKNSTYLDEARKNIAFAEERFNSAVAWSKFFNNDQEDGVFFEEEILKKGCNKKLDEANERFQYVNIYSSNLLHETRIELEQAKTDRDEGQYELCIFKASKAKAEADVILNLIGIENKYLEQIIDEKLKIAETEIARQRSFPFIAYSYYEYSGNLKESDKYSSLLYSEYALELANLNQYLKKDGYQIELSKDKKIAVFLLVLLLLVVTAYYRHIRS